MSKMSELAIELNELKRCGEILISISDTLAEMFSTCEQDNHHSNKEQTEVKPEKLPTIADVRRVLAEKAREGHTTEVKELLVKYGADKLSDINPKNYALLLADAEVI